MRGNSMSLLHYKKGNRASFPNVLSRKILPIPRFSLLRYTNNSYIILSKTILKSSNLVACKVVAQIKQATFNWTGDMASFNFPTLPSSTVLFLVLFFVYMT